MIGEVSSNEWNSKPDDRASALRVVLITQDEPFFLARSFEYLFQILHPSITVVGCVLLAPSPFGKRESLLSKLKRTYAVFGLRFFIYYSAAFAVAKLRPNQSVARALTRRGVEIIRLAKGINDPESLGKIKSYYPDVLVSIAGNEIFRKPLIDLAPKGCLNLHSALLPKYRGLMPSFWVLRHKEQESGVSVFFVNKGIDTGPILVQKRFSIKGMSQRDLIKYSKMAGMDAVAEALGKILLGRMETMPNDDSEASYFSFPTRNDVIAFRGSGARFF